MTLGHVLVYVPYCKHKWNFFILEGGGKKF